MRRNMYRDKNDAREIEPFTNFFCRAQRPPVNGIEGPAEKTDSVMRFIMLLQCKSQIKQVKRPIGEKAKRIVAGYSPFYLLTCSPLLRSYLPLSVHNKFCRGEFDKPHGAEGMQL